jgi:small subunit ribosomal protein S4e
MAKKHMKRVTAPASWMIERKVQKFISLPKGSYSMKTGMSLVAVLKDVLKLVNTRKEGKRVLNNKEIIVNGKRRKDEKFMIGLMDVLQIKEIGKSYRMILDNRGVLRLITISGAETSIKPCRVNGKRTIRNGKIQLSFHDGRTFLGKAENSIGDTIMISLPDGKEKQSIKLEKGCQAYLTGGSNVGLTGTVDNISGEKATIKIGNDVIETETRSVFVIGKEKPLIKLDFGENK